MNDSPLWFSTEQLADRYGVPVATIRKWRAEGTGPVGVRFGRHVRYHRTESVEPWERDQAAKQLRVSA